MTTRSSRRSTNDKALSVGINVQSKVVLNELVVGCRTELTPHMADWDLLDKGFSYDVVAVFGSQSTGKSKLLSFLLDRARSDRAGRVEKLDPR